ncbi:MAG: histidine kinase [Bacteroidia bacterium]|nr:histidine kinase [Bacteroidia bacterium]
MNQVAFVTEFLRKEHNVRLLVAGILAILGLFLRQIAGFGFVWWMEIVFLVVMVPVILVWWEIFARIDRFLHWAMPYEKGVGKRIVVQLGTGALIFMGFRQVMVLLFAEKIGIQLSSMHYVMLISTDFFGSAAVNLGFVTSYFIGRWRDAQLYDERFRREKAQLQLDHLKNQVNPHFLFNAFSSLDSLIRTDPPLASEFVQHMARVYRYALQHKEKTLVSLREELVFIRDYIALLKIRYEQGLEIRVHVSPAAEDQQITIISLQMLLDNALKHNEVHPDHPLTIEIYDDGAYLVVANNKQLRRHLIESNRQGLAQLSSLYQLLVSRAVVVEDTPTRFTVKLPLI